MDFMKVIDQTVREIKREVNLKVLKVPEIEQKVLDATDNEPWGPHGTALAEIAQATKKFTECQMVMNVLWTRLRETGKDWRYVYKALTVIEYLIGNGSERAVDDIIEHTLQISSLVGFEYVEPNGKDMGINVRKKAEKIAALLNDKEKIQEARNKAAATREKYIGLSSTGMSYKSSAASYSGGGGGGSFQSSNRYGGFSSRYDTDGFKDSYQDKVDDQFEKYVPKSRQVASTERNTRYSSKDQDVPSSGLSKSASQTNSDKYNVISQGANASLNSQVDDDDDFDPRGTNMSNAKPTTGGSQQVDLFGESLMGDFIDASSSVPPQSSATDNKSADVDLFSDTDFVSATPKLESGGNSQPQANIDLFSSEPAPSRIVSSTMDFFASPDPVTIPATTKSKGMGPSNLTTVDPFATVSKSESTSPSNLTTVDPFAAVSKSESTDPSNLTTVDPFGTVPKSGSTGALNLTTVDPFATVPTNSFDGSDLFGSFTSHTDQSSSAPKQNPLDISTTNDVSGKSMSESKAPSKKDGFQVKSGIWADSLSRGLIDLNISGPKKVNLADVGIIGDLTIGSEEKQKGPTTSYYMGSAMGMGSGVSRTGANPAGTTGDDFFSSFSGTSSQYQFNGFQK